MELTAVLELFSRYGAFILLVITCLEAMNCPGMPAGVVLPAVGIYAASGGMSVFFAALLTVIGGTIGTVLLYLVGRAGGHALLNWLAQRSKTFRKASVRCEAFLQKSSFQKVFLGRIIPVVRTILPLPAGAYRVSPLSFVMASVLGITCYNAVCIGAGYLLGYVFV